LGVTVKIYRGTRNTIDELSYALQFRSVTSEFGWSFYSNGGTVALKGDQASAANGLQVTQTGSGIALKVDQNTAQQAFQVNMGSSATGVDPVQINGQDYGPNINTNLNNGRALTIIKNGTGAGTVVQVNNKGTGVTLDLQSNGTSTMQALVAGQLYMAKSSALSTNSAGGFLYVASDGSLRYKSSAGTDSLIGAA
jgi:hypothetical protein